MIPAPAIRRLLPAVLLWSAALLLLLVPSCASMRKDAAADRIYRVAVVSPGPPTPLLAVFKLRLAELGYAEGMNLVIDGHYGDGRVDRLPELVARALERKPDVIFAGSTIATLAAKKATTTVPIVFAGLFEPLATGVVTDLARPGGNITGATMDVAGVDLYGRWVELLTEAKPALSHIAVLSNPEGLLTERNLRKVHAAAKSANVKVEVMHASSAAALDTALAAIGNSGAQALLVMPDPLFTPNRDKLARFASEKRLPSMYFFRIFADAGGLMSYGASVDEAYRTAAQQVAAIFRGANPGDIPVQSPDRAELVVNTKAAKGMGIMLPQPLLKRADKLVTE